MDFLAMQREIFELRPRCSTLAVHPVPKPQGSGSIGGATLWWMQEAAQQTWAPRFETPRLAPQAPKKVAFCQIALGVCQKMAKVHGE